VIHGLRQRGWGEAQVFKNPVEVDLLAKWRLFDESEAAPSNRRDAIVREDDAK
jgi:hypothetical protein